MATKTLQTKIIDRLKNDDGTDPVGIVLVGDTVDNGLEEHASWSGILVGGVWKKRITQFDAKNPKGSTKEAFSRAGHIRTCVFVNITPGVPHRQADVFKAIVTTANFFIYSQSHDNGTLAMEYARQRIEQLMDGWTFKTDIAPGEDNGPIGFPELSFWQGPIDNHAEFSGSKLDVLRYDITYRRSFSE